MPFEMQTLTAFVIVDKNGDEGIMGFLNEGTQQWIPLIGADEARMESMYPMAVKISEAVEQPFKVLQFSTRTDVTEAVKAKHGSLPSERE